jgi:hypothetical protein
VQIYLKSQTKEATNHVAGSFRIQKRAHLPEPDAPEFVKKKLGETEGA